MERSDYLKLKKYNKDLARLIKSQKPLVKELNRDAGKKFYIWESPSLEWRNCHSAIGQLHKMQLDFRIRHIFLSLLRGKTRQQIEWNYEDAPFEKSYWMEKGLEKLCVEYGLEFERDGESQSKTFIEEIHRPWIIKKAS